MNKAELVSSVAEKAELTKEQATSAVEAFVESAKEALQDKKDGELALSGFGRFHVQTRAARTGRNPATGKPIKIAAKKVIKFKVAKDFKEAVN